MKELSREQRWQWLKEKQQEEKWTIPWDRMVFPSHEWLDEVITFDSYDAEDFSLHKGRTIKVPRYI